MADNVKGEKVVDTSDRIIRLYSRLKSLKENLPQTVVIIDERYVKEYHSIIDELEKVTNSDLVEFRVPDAQIQPTVKARLPTGEIIYSKNKYCDKSFMLVKLGGLLSYFQIAYLSEEKKTIGFKRHS